MKPLPSGNNIELKAKAVEILVVLHGLRHENINPLIGCLAEPPRAALVSEWCARGSLQDVLQQDDIKLDWSFRLSLLTDLVRVSTTIVFKQLFYNSTYVEEYYIRINDFMENFYNYSLESLFSYIMFY